ncbi:MAG TPA: D-alanyl-D-alanine carboxypeptidase [Thermoanaerobaculia bacterium]|jgi:D-alanyl-D-alanine carboxypeptidase/D-alanyl-D-alanine-endopeptidase (penicillin-binding protein 4)|nr:D-alanyl-D-alanine carboxypeptidase [Thermoanaerobaculia bacterium]
MELRVTTLILTAALLSACTTTTTQPIPTLAPTIDAAIHRPPFHHAFWSILVEDGDGRILYSLNADKLTIPASNRKLFTSATVAECFGIDSQLTTEVWRDNDDLVLRGDGDPSLGSWRFERSGDFDRLAETLRARGITRVRDVIADVSLFDRDTFPGGWKHGNMGSDYAAPVDALSWGENEIPVDRAVPDPGLHAATVLREALILGGIEVTGLSRVNTERRAWSERITTLPSPFIGHLLMPVLKNSHNLYAEMLLKRTFDGTYDGAFANERAFLTAIPKVEGDSFRFVDGSGLAPDDLVTPQATIRLLRWMNEPSRRAFWWATLAQPNNDGTLRRRLASLEDRLRGKTGTINGVAALSGILMMPDGGVRYFVVVVNHHPGDGDGAVGIIDEIVGAIAR